jgi:ankyrin repeat protein
MSKQVLRADSQGIYLENDFILISSMYIAAQKGHLDIVKCLVEHGASANAAAGILYGALLN